METFKEEEMEKIISNFKIDLILNFLELQKAKEIAKLQIIKAKRFAKEIENSKEFENSILNF